MEQRKPQKSKPVVLTVEESIVGRRNPRESNTVVRMVSYANITRRNTLPS